MAMMMALARMTLRFANVFNLSKVKVSEALQKAETDAIQVVWVFLHRYV